MRKLLCLAFLFLSALTFAQTTVTVSGHPITGQNATPSGGVSILWELANDNSQQCKINGTGIIVPASFSVTPAQLAAGISIIPNNIIVCGSTLGASRWRYTIKASGIGTRQCPLNITANINLDSAVCLNATATPTTTVPAASLFLLLDGSNSLTGNFLPTANGTQAIGSSALRWNMFANTANITNLTVTGTCTGCGGGGSTPTGTGFTHITAGVQDGTAKTVDVSSADTTGVLKAASFPALTGDVTTSAGALATTLATVATPATNTKITYDAKGRVTSGAQAQFSDIGGVGSCAQEPAMTGDITSSGCAATLATVATPATATKVTFNAKGLVTSSGTTDVSSADITGVLKAAAEPAHTGDVTNSAGSLAMTIAAGAVTRAKEAADGKGWAFCGTATGATTTVGPVNASTCCNGGTCRQFQIYYNIEGYNGRLDAIQAGLLHVKLQHLAKWNEQRRERAMEYQRLFGSSGNPVNAPYEPSWSRAVFHLYVVRTKDREGMMDFLKNEGIATGIHYPIPLHMQKAYDNLSYAPGDFPVSERVAAEIVSLPMFPQLTTEQQAKVAKEVKRFVQSRSSKPVAGEAKDLAVAERMA